MKLTKSLEKFSVSFNTMINLLLKNSSDSNNFNAVRKAVDYFSKIIYIIIRCRISKCRLLEFIKGITKIINIQERFFFNLNIILSF